MTVGGDTQDTQLRPIISCFVFFVAVTVHRRPGLPRREASMGEEVGLGGWLRSGVTMVKLGSDLLSSWAW